jgi:hypothetical protein
MFDETKAKLESKEIELKLEVEARMNREMQIREMEDTLNKETERAQDLKVRSITFSLYHLGGYNSKSAENLIFYFLNNQIIFLCRLRILILIYDLDLDYDLDVDVD